MALLGFVVLMGIWGVVAAFAWFVRNSDPFFYEYYAHRHAVEGRKIWIPLKRAKKDWQLAKVPDFVKFLDEALKKEGPKKQKMKWRIDQPPLQSWDEYLSQYNIDDQNVQKIKDNLKGSYRRILGSKTQNKAISPSIPPLEVAATEEGNCCFPFFGETFAKLKNAASRKFKHPLLDAFKALLKAEIDIANRAAKDLFDDSQKHNRILLPKRPLKNYHYPDDDDRQVVGFLSSEEVQDLYWDKKTVAEEWTHLELRADTPNLSSSGKALKHVEKLCGGRLIPMDSQTEDSWTVRVGAYWFILFQVIRQSGLPLDKSFDLFSKAAKDSCEWTLQGVEKAWWQAHQILAESRTWPLVRQVSHAFLRASEGGGLLFPLGWSTDKISDKMWIDRIFKETMVSEFQYALRLDPPPPEISSIEEISHLLRQRNFASFHVEFSAHLREVVDDEWRMMLAKNVSAKAVAA